MYTNLSLKFFMFTIIMFVGLLSGCQSTSSNDILSGADNMFGDPLVMDSPLNELDGLPTDGDRSIFSPIYFSYDSSTINPDQISICEDVAQYLENGGGVILEGHGDERGSREYNLALGERRALSVRQYLIQLGVDASQIQTRSFGEEKPANPSHDEQAWSKNRRVEFAVY